MLILEIRGFDRQVRRDSSHAQAPKKALMNKSLMKNLVGQHKGSRGVTSPVPCAGYWPWLGMAFPWKCHLEQATGTRPRLSTSHTSSFDTGIFQT